MLTFATGCQMGGPNVQTPMRAIWVTRFDYKTAGDVEKIVENCADAGFNTVLFQVRGNATAFYPSKIEPWAEQFGFEDPGFDPLKLACDAAHDRGVELHAWVNVMPAWRGGRKPPANQQQLYHTHPEWFWYDKDGNRQALTSFYVSVNPCLPAVRDYLVSVFEEIVANYDVDGLHMDYIRFPNERPERGAPALPDYPRDAETLALYQAASGKAPDDDADAWNQWRTDQVTQLVADIQQMMRRVKPKTALSASVGADYEGSLRHFRDDRGWARDRLLDFAVLMNYTDDPAQFAERTESWMSEAPPIPIVPGLWFGRHRDQSTDQAIGAVHLQIEVARSKTDNYCVFSYSSLFDSVDTELSNQTQAQSDLRTKRRAALVPLIQRHAALDQAAQP